MPVGFSIVGNFVVLVAGRGERMVRKQVLRLEDLLGGLGDVLSRNPASQRRLRLDREAVHRQVWEVEFEGSLQISLPASVDRGWHSEDEIYREVIDASFT